LTFQPIYDIAEVCSRKNIQNVVICPGSRSAPLTLGFVSHRGLRSWSIPDERSAGFIALGMAQSSLRPVALVCTSGTAALNFYPAIAEAFYQRLPLIVFTADRPPEWIDQLDGQSIRQKGVYGAHVKASYQLPADYTHADSVWAVQRIVNEAINLSLSAPAGPVHVNCPFREPLYPPAETAIRFSKGVRIIHKQAVTARIDSAEEKNLKQILAGKRILVVGGHSAKGDVPAEALSALSLRGIPVIGEVHSNLHEVKDLISHTDLYLGHLSGARATALRPDVLISFGQSLLTRNLKTFLRRHKPVEHIHVEECTIPADPLQSLTRHVGVSPSAFFTWWSENNSIRSGSTTQRAYREAWTSLDQHAAKALSEYLGNHVFGELTLTREILNHLPANTHLHLGNSMAVRYANLCGIPPKAKGIEVFCNRGTSGIDGSTSTAMGHALVSGKPTVLITGDMGFFYDRNAFWHTYSVKNFTAAVINNHGGVIFNLIDGPARLKYARDYFTTPQKLTAKALSAEFGLDYVQARNAKLQESLIRKTKGMVIELESDGGQTRKQFESFKAFLKKRYEAY
jgi:2-succinyl-5-enolpyruvyl-6-hydroxy-3-cyclohexene-1-carboxylate synthase